MRIASPRFISRLHHRGNRIKVPPSPSLGVVSLAREAIRQANADSLGIYAASLAYRGLFATFLLLILLVSLLGLFSATDLVGRLLDRVALGIPGPVLEMLRNQLPGAEERGTRALLSVGAVASALAALWGVSSAFRSAMHAMNVMYKVREERPFWKRYAISIGLALAVTILTASAMILVVFGGSLGDSIADAAGLGALFSWTWNVIQWPILASFVLLAFALVYYYAPDVRQRFRFVTPGSLIGLCLWLGFSVLFLVFINVVGAYRRIYGAIAGVAIHTLYMYYFSYILLLGAEINQVVEEHTPGGKKAGEKAPGRQ